MGARRRKPKQGTFDFPSWGGPRKKSGRKPKGVKAGVSHKTRSELKARFPVHVTTTICDGLAGLRNPREYFTVLKAMRQGCNKAGFRLVQYSVQSTHVHMIVEANDRTSLSRGLQGLFVRIARALNRLWERKGQVFADRYHDRILRTPKEVKNCLRYLFFNWKKHTEDAGIYGNIDLYTSAPWFDGWNRPFKPPRGVPREGPMAAARTWLLRIGWRRHGLLPAGNAPT